MSAAISFKEMPNDVSAIAKDSPNGHRSKVLAKDS